MKTLIFLTLGIFIFLGAMFLLFKKIWAKQGGKRGGTIATNLEAIEKEKKESTLSKRLFSKVMGSLGKKP